VIIETCPLLNELPWIRHGFFGKDNPAGLTNGLNGIHAFTDQFPITSFLKQAHTDVVVDCNSDVEADASVTDQTDYALAIKTADCCPILLVCTATKQIAAVHAGWRGALNQITKKAIQKLLNNGSTAATIIAAIGPSIHVSTYPVEDDLRDSFLASLPWTAPHFERFEDRWKLDVAGIVIQQTKCFGITQIWQSPTNTFENPDFSSYRRFKAGIDPVNTRNISVIMKINP
jgi:polyphenol oxidase